MVWDSIIWDDESEPGGNVDKIQQHGLTMDDVENALADPISHDISRSSGRPILWGLALDGRLIVVVYEEVDEFTVRPVTAWADRESEP
jgi:uncharacterized DUF497 family protein